MRTPIRSGSSGCRLHNAPPQLEQKHFANPSSGCQHCTSSSPWVIRNEPGATRAEHAAADPVRRWQRLQWQYPAEMSGSAIS